jgi:formylmethanofuran dehydrogenase subunit E
MYIKCDVCGISFHEGNKSEHQGKIFCSECDDKYAATPFDEIPFYES